MLFSFFNIKNSVLRLLFTLIGIILVYLGLNFLLKVAKRKLFKKAKTKKEKTNIEIFFDASRYTLILVLIIFAIFSYTGSLTGFGLATGLLTAAFGFALQKPITGIAGWIMLVVKRPFEIGDRVLIGNIKGDVVDITLTHVHIGEIGGTIPSEERSGRIVLIPNATLFDTNIINYTQNDRFVLDQISFSITYQSNLSEATKISKEAALEVLKKYTKIEKLPQKPYCRTYFQPNGIDIYVRFFTIAEKRNEISSEVTEVLFERIKKAKNIRFAYPHTEILISKEK